MLRAGFEIAFEDETDTSRKHPEFYATHKRLGDRVAVEAKSKWRRGVIEWKLGAPPLEEFSLNIQDRLQAALEKESELPLLVFIDANMPPDVARDAGAKWLPEMSQVLQETALKQLDLAKGVFHGVPFSALIMTNFPHDYAGPGEPDPGKIGFISIPAVPRRPLGHPEILNDIERAVKQYGKVPSDFSTQ